MPLLEIPSDRKANYTPGAVDGVGIVGGIYDMSTWRQVDMVTDYGCDPTGVADCSGPLNAVYYDVKNVYHQPTIINFPAGEYRFNSPVGTPQFMSLICIRGAGKNLTFFKFYTSESTNVFLVFGVEATFGSSGEVRATGVGLHKGSYTIETTGDLDAFGTFLPGQHVRLNYENMMDEALIEAGETPQFDVKLFPDSYSEVKQMISKTSNSITFSSPIIRPTPTGKTAKLGSAYFSDSNGGYGIEDLTVELDNSITTFGIRFDVCHGCWMKNVNVFHTSNYSVFFNNCIQMEMHGCRLELRKGGGSNGAGLLMNGTCNSLIQDSICNDLFPLMEINGGSSGNAFLYNAGEKSVLDINHGGGNWFNLFEGNQFPFIQSDGYFGGSFNDIFFRNKFFGSNSRVDVGAPGFYIPPFILNRLARHQIAIGNDMGRDLYPYSGHYSFGNPNLGNGSYDEVKSMMAGDFPTDWKMTATLLSGTGTTSGTMQLISGTARHHQVGIASPELGGEFTVEWSGSPYAQAGDIFSFTMGHAIGPSPGTILNIAPGAQGWQFFDLDVEATALMQDNYLRGSIITDGVPAGEVSGNTLPASLVYDAKPDFMGDRDWPPFGPDISGVAGLGEEFERIPAAYRLYNDDDGPPEAVLTPSFSPAAGIFATGQNIEITTETSGATIRYTIDGSTPTPSHGTVYSSAVFISSTTTLKAIAYNGVIADSPVRIGVFTIVSDVPTLRSARAKRFAKHGD